MFKAPFFSNENEHRLFFDPIEYEFYQGIISKFDADFFKEKKAESLECYYNLEKVLCLLKKDVKYALMRNGINSYLSLNLNLFKEQKEKLIEEIILGPKCVQDISTLNDFLISSGYKANIKNSAIQIR